MPLRRANGEMCVFGIGVDITERKRLEESLAAQKDFLQTLVDAVPDLVFAKRQPVPREPDRSSAASTSVGVCASTTGRRPELVAGGSGPARENPGWGYTRIRDALGNLGYELARTTIRAILKEQDIEPAPERSRRTSWETFLRTHWQAITACDFFTIEVLTWTGITRFYVMFVIALQTRRVEIAGIVRQPHGAWMLQAARNLLDAGDGFLKPKLFLLLDRDPLYTVAFRELLRSAGSGLSACRRAAPT